MSKDYDKVRKANPSLERVLDEIEVAKWNLPLDSTDADRSKFDELHEAVLAQSRKQVPSKEDVAKQDKAEAEAKKPQ